MLKSQEFSVGEIIKVKSLWTIIAKGYPIWHYGVVVANNHVIHFKWDATYGEPMIVKTSMDEFIGHGTNLQKCYISNRHQNYEPTEIALRAYKALGTDFGGYKLLSNNCEHFANWCAYGSKFSNQVPFSEDEHSFGRKMKENMIIEPVFKTRKFFENVIDGCEKILDYCEKI